MRYVIIIQTDKEDVANRIRKRLEKDEDYKSHEFVSLQGPLEKCDSCAREY